ncbi:MAG: hypothetical protein AAB462_03710 [Patescibacteria group bacterium]
MTSGEISNGELSAEQQAGPEMNGIQVAVTDLGPRNKGTFGPHAGIAEADCVAIAEAAASEAYTREPTNRWRCVDGRQSPEEVQGAGRVGEAYADPQIAGSIPVSETAAAFMDEPTSHKPHSQNLADKTRQAIEDGLEVIVHGDDANHKAGCKANVDVRNALLFNAENSDVVVPKVWEISKALGLQHWIDEDDVTKSVVSGAVAAKNDSLWDVTPEQAVDIMVANGAEYEELVDVHSEMTERVDITPTTFDKTSFIQDHSTPASKVQAFAASLGCYKQEAFRRAAIHGQHEREAALQTMRVVLFNAGLSKTLITEGTKVGLVVPAQ